MPALTINNNITLNKLFGNILFIYMVDNTVRTNTIVWMKISFPSRNSEISEICFFVIKTLLKSAKTDIINHTI